MGGSNQPRRHKHLGREENPWAPSGFGQGVPCHGPSTPSGGEIEGFPREKALSGAAYRGMEPYPGALPGAHGPLARRAGAGANIPWRPRTLFENVEFS